MLLKAFRIKNYKSFVDSGFCSVQKGVTIFAGQNESGKSNILTALSKINEKSPTFAADEYSFGQVESPEITYYFELSEEETQRLKESFPDVDVESEVQVDVREKARNISIDYTVDGDETDSAAIEPKLIQSVEQFLPKFILYKTVTDDIPDTFTAQDTGKTPIKRLSKYLNTDFSTIFSGKNQQQQRNATQKLSRMISEDFAAKYRQKDVRLEFDINSTTMSIYIRDKKPGTDEYGYSFQLSQRSTGLRWYLNFYIALKGEDLKAGDIILVDEPGMYLHPKAQQEMRGILNEESMENQIVYTTHSPYLIDADNMHQIRLVEKMGSDSDDGYNEVSVIRERIHHSSNIDTLKPILDAIGYSLGSELNFKYQKVLICEGVSDYYYLKALELICEEELQCGITHANGCNNIGRIASLFQGIGVSEIFALVDSDDGGIKERTKLVEAGVFDEKHIMATHEAKNIGKAIEDVFNREWYLKKIFAYTDEEIKKADPTLSKEVHKKKGGAKYVWAKKLFELARTGTLIRTDVLDQSASALLEKLLHAVKDDSYEESDQGAN